jgi:hypothetical protein
MCAGDNNFSSPTEGGKIHAIRSLLFAKSKKFGETEALHQLHPCPAHEGEAHSVRRRASIELQGTPTFKRPTRMNLSRTELVNSQKEPP